MNDKSSSDQSVNTFGILWPDKSLAHRSIASRSQILDSSCQILLHRSLPAWRGCSQGRTSFQPNNFIFQADNLRYIFRAYTPQPDRVVIIKIKFCTGSYWHFSIQLVPILLHVPWYSHLIIYSRGLTSIHLSIYKISKKGNQNAHGQEKITQNGCWSSKWPLFLLNLDVSSQKGNHPLKMESLNMALDLSKRQPPNPSDYLKPVQSNLNGKVM